MICQISCQSHCADDLTPIVEPIRVTASAAQAAEVEKVRRATTGRDAALERLSQNKREH